MIKKTLVSISLLVTLSASFSALATGINAMNPFVRAVPPGAQVTAAFMQLHNTTDEDRQLVAASSPLAQAVELHTHTQVEGVMQMRRVAEIAIAAQSQTSLQPGGLHLMLIGLKETPAQDDQVALTLEFDDGSLLELNVPVRPAGRGHGQGQGHGHGHKMN
ncbi:copper chaperone PCu(A)C [Marinospirillum perlucidum]|uniref:copper chaperone PCu(A)C n=1 Tax=Marinospirillum perlucidum TaxID=1982602 RepID=UPI000DF4BE13|nr:copper chaperone PCu(A)C [Marinospirillum perlucidum]